MILVAVMADAGLFIVKSVGNCSPVKKRPGGLTCSHYGAVSKLP